MTAMGASRPWPSNCRPILPSLVRTVQGLLLHQHWAGSLWRGIDRGAAAGAASARPPSRCCVAFASSTASRSTSPAPWQRGSSQCAGISRCCRGMLRAKACLRAPAVASPITSSAGCSSTAGYASAGTPTRGAGCWWIAQLDALQREQLPIDSTCSTSARSGCHRRRRVAACRAGKADPAQFGILDVFGLVRGRQRRPRRGGAERLGMLPWDVWGAMPQPGGRSMRPGSAARPAGRADAGAGCQLAELRRTYADEPRPGAGGGVSTPCGAGWSRSAGDAGSAFG